MLVGEAPKRTFDIVVTFYRSPEKPKRGNLRFSASALLRRIFGARSAHTDTTNGLLPHPSSASSQDGKHLQVKGLDPVSVGTVASSARPTSRICIRTVVPKRYR